MNLIDSKLIEKEQDVLAAIANAIALIQKQTGYGSVEVTVHDGRVTQIERREKVRFETKSNTIKK
ncbi:MAG: YezD family protein [Methylophilus sp.]|nr:YezD family protein [Methylophilus sp.]